MAIDQSLSIMCCWKSTYCLLLFYCIIFCNIIMQSICTCLSLFSFELFLTQKARWMDKISIEHDLTWPKWKWIILQPIIWPNSNVNWIWGVPDQIKPACSNWNRGFYSGFCFKCVNPLFYVLLRNTESQQFSIELKRICIFLL